MPIVTVFTDRVLPLSAMILSAAIFGFFYAWICSTMWGLDSTDPRVAIKAMQAMNASVRNGVFFPAFFLTPVVCAIATVGLWVTGARQAGLWFLAAAVTYVVGGLGITMVMHIPMNEALSLVEVGEDIEAARAIWHAYSPDWQFWNITRTVVCGVVVVMAGLGLLSIGAERARE